MELIVHKTFRQKAPTEIGIRWIRVSPCVVALIPFLGLALFQVQSFAVGCPHGSDHWFNATVEIDPKSLPAGITAARTIAQEGSGYTGVDLTNSTTIPLVINSPDLKRTYFEHYPRPFTLKFVSGDEYYCDVLSKPMKCDMKSDALLDTPEISKAVLTGAVSKDNRPRAVRLPNSEPFQFAAFYGDRPVIIRGTVSFSLNDQYDPLLGMKTKQGCDDAQPSPLPPGTQAYELPLPQISMSAPERGQYVDVVLTYGAGDGRRKEVIMHRVIVYAVAHVVPNIGTGHNEQGGSITLTLAVDPADAERLDHAKKKRDAMMSVEISNQAQ